MLNAALIRWTGLGSIAGGITWLALWTLFLLTHRPGPEDRKGTMFLLTSLDYSKFAVVPVFLFDSGLVGLHSQQKERSGLFGMAGLAIALLGFAVMVARQILQTLATGTPEARLTQEAKASLERLAKRRVD